MSKPYRVQFVCTGNICRSPMGEVILRDLLEQEGLGDKVIVDSAGTDGWHVGDPADPRTLQTLRRAGYGGSAHRAKQISVEDLAQRDLVLVADRGHLKAVRRIVLRTHGTTSVDLIRSYDRGATSHELDDPYYGDDEAFDRCRDEVEAACKGIVDELRERLEI